MPSILRKKWLVLSAVSILVLVGIGGVCAWVMRPGCFSHFNYDRIQSGMSRQQVAELLGSPGQEIPINWIPGHPQDTHLPGAPPGWTGVVWGDTVVRWNFGNATILVAFVDGRVNSKDYWEPSF